MIHIIITSYGEPVLTIRAVKSFLNQDIKEEYKIIVADPFPEIGQVLEKEFGKNKNIDFFLDPGEGKSYALNLLDRKSTRLNSSHIPLSRMPSSA